MDIKRLNEAISKVLKIKKGLNEELDDAMKSVLSNYDDKIIALALFLDIDLEPDYDSYVDEDASAEEQEEQRQDAIDEVTAELDNITDDGDDLYSYGHQEYNVYTDSEADTAWDEQADNYIEEVILPEIPEPYKNYFDEDSWKSDVATNGRGSLLAHYDGTEEEIEYNGTWYYIYRQN